MRVPPSEVQSGSLQVLFQVGLIVLLLILWTRFSGLITGSHDSAYSTFDSELGSSTQSVFFIRRISSWDGSEGLNPWSSELSMYACKE
jgi:hypothetical protein